MSLPSSPLQERSSILHIEKLEKSASHLWHCLQRAVCGGGLPTTFCFLAAPPPFVLKNSLLFSKKMPWKSESFIADQRKPEPPLYPSPTKTPLKKPWEGLTAARTHSRGLRS